MREFPCLWSMKHAEKTFREISSFAVKTALFQFIFFWIAGDQVVHQIATRNIVLCQWANLKDFQNTFHHRYVVQSGKKASRSLPRSTVDLHRFVYIIQCHRLTTVKCISSQAMECKMTTLMIDGSNVSTSYWCLKFVAMNASMGSQLFVFLPKTIAQQAFLFIYYFRVFLQ